MSGPDRPIVRLRPNVDPRPIRRGAPWAYVDQLVLDRRTRAVPAGSLVELQDAEREKRGGSVSGCPLGDAGAEQGGCPSGRDMVGLGASVAADNSVEGLETRFGRLVVDEGRSRYINNSFWASLNNEVSALAAVVWMRRR